jgi:hypothetical protein
MSQASIEQRVAAIENELERLKGVVENDPKPWWHQIFGTFKDDPVFDEAMRLGRVYRKSLRPKSKSRSSSPRKKTNGRA